MKNPEIYAEEQRAVALERSGDEAAAAEIWLHLAQISPQARFYCRAGGLLQSLERRDEAEAVFRASREIDPTLELASISLASLLIDSNKPAEAVELLDAVVSDHESALAYAFLGSALMLLDRADDALHAFRQAIALDPGYDEAYYNIGMLLRDRDHAGAQFAFQRAIELDLNYSNARRELGWLLSRQNFYEAAERHLRRAIELDSSDARAWVYLGNVFWRTNRPADAKEAFESAKKHALDEWYPHWAIATFYEDGNIPQKAARFYHNALSVSPDNAVILFHYGRFLLRQGDREGGQKYLVRALQVDPEYDTARRLLAEMGG